MIKIVMHQQWKRRTEWSEGVVYYWVGSVLFETRYHKDNLDDSVYDLKTKSLGQENPISLHLGLGHRADIPENVVEEFISQKLAPVLVCIVDGK